MHGRAGTAQLELSGIEPEPVEAVASRPDPADDPPTALTILPRLPQAQGAGAEHACRRERRARPRRRNKTRERSNPVTVDLEALKVRQQATWASGDYAAIGTTLQIVGEQLCETIDLAPGSKVLDVAAGNGNATLAAARRFCEVTSTDYVPALLARAGERASAERQRVTFQVEDAENLSFPEASFDVVLSTFGVMFVADHHRAAAEMLRVCRPGGTIAMANWTPEGFIGQVFKTIGAHVPPPPGARSPALWGTEAAIEAMFGEAPSTIRCVPQRFAFRYRSADALHRVLPHPLRPGAQGVPGGGERGRGARGRPAGAARADEHRPRRHARRALGLRGGRHPPQGLTGGTPPPHPPARAPRVPSGRVRRRAATRARAGLPFHGVGRQYHGSDHASRHAAALDAPH